MDRLRDYRSIIQRILAEHLENAPQEEDVETVSINDEAGEHYLLLEIGWQPPRRIYNVVFHLRLKEGKIWVEQDWTEYGIARELMEAGIPAEAIELGFQPPEMRPYIEWSAPATGRR
ncbi:MAG: hypothetical protein Fur0044_13210 [Anaerolineae bacterium]